MEIKRLKEGQEINQVIALKKFTLMMKVFTLK